MRCRGRESLVAKEVLRMRSMGDHRETMEARISYKGFRRVLEEAGQGRVRVPMSC